MVKFFRLLGIIIAISLLALPLLTACEAPWESGMALNLKVDSPKDGSTVTTATVTVSGRVTGTESAAARVTINNQDAPVKDGKFSTSITLTEGSNVITVVATGGAAKLNQTVTVTYAPAK